MNNDVQTDGCLGPLGDAQPTTASVPNIPITGRVALADPTGPRWKRWLTNSFRSLRSPNYRLWAAGALVSNIGTWVQRTAQDWLVLTDLTHNSASAVGMVMALQFGPQLLFLPWVGLAADRLDRRRLVMVTQMTMGVLALMLGALTVTGAVRLWHVYVFAFLSGSASALDAPARQTFVNDLVGDVDLPNAVALNSTSFNAARTVGPALAGLCISSWGTGLAFLLNGASFLTVVASLFLIRRDRLRAVSRATKERAGLAASFRYIASRSDLRTMMTMLVLIGAFALNFPIFISTMSVTVFGLGAERYGLLTSAMAVGTMFGAVLAAGRDHPTMRTVTTAAVIIGVGLVSAAAMPSFWLFGLVLLPVGMATLTFTNSSNSLTQLATEPTMRGRVLAIRLSAMSGVTLVGAPLVGTAADRFGPRWALVLGGVASLAAAAIGMRHLTFDHPSGSRVPAGPGGSESDPNAA